jgi:hypothetical protein
VLVLFEGSPGAVSAQVATAQALVGGVEAAADAWEASRERQAEARGRLRFDPGLLAETLAGLEEAVVRPAAGVAYTPGDTVSRGSDPAVERLVARIERQFDPNGVLAA